MILVTEDNSKSHLGSQSLGSYHKKFAPQKPSYLDLYAKTYNFSKTGLCGQFAKVGICSGCGKRYVKVLFCGKEWCLNCQDILHKRRQARLLPKIWTMKRAGYFVFTIPEEMREYFKEKEHLSALRSYLRKKLKRIFPELKAITRWHWFGDRNLTKYHPHLNVLVDSIQRLPEGVLGDIKESYQRYLERVTGICLGSKRVDVHYQFLREKVRILHKLKYITRPTFLVYQKELAQKLKGYRTGTVWGKFRELTLDEMERLAIQKEMHCSNKDTLFLANSTCPQCLKSINWTGGLYSAGIVDYGEEIGNGYYALAFWPRAGPVKLPGR